MSEHDRLKLLVEAITDYAVYMLDETGVVSSWNSGAERIKGYSAGEIIGQHFSRFYTVEDRKAGGPQKALRTAAREGRYEAEGWRLRKDGERFWAHVVIDPIRASGGRVIGFAKVTRDLTERRATQEALRRSEHQFRLLVQGVTDYAIYMLDPEGRVSSWNPGAERIKGYRPEEIIGEHFSRFYTDEDQAAGLPATGLETAAGKGRFEREGWRVRKDGSRFWANVVIEAIRSETGELVGFAKITRDNTERREAEAALEQAREALFQSQKMDAIGQLTGGVAHDFNNLLMAILGSLELIRKRAPDDPRITPLIDNALQGAQRGASLTQRMLAFARRQDLQPQKVDLPALVAGMKGLLERSLGPTVQIETRFSPGLSAVTTDPNQLEMALLNLSVNARDAMPGGGRIRIAAEDREVTAGLASGLAAGRYVRLAVSDTGEGMDEETLARASEPFFTTKGVGKGTGLGLSMVHGLAHQSGGEMRLLSRPGEGTTVELWLPRCDAPATASAEDGGPHPGPAAAQRPLTILAVDDDELVLINTAAMLEDLGHTVVRAGSGAEALALLDRHADLDLVISDHAMPRMSGLELSTAIHERRPALPFILASGFAELPPGASSLLRLSKPFRQMDLARAVQDALDRAPSPVG